MVDVDARRDEVADLVQTRWGDLLTEIGATVVERDDARLPPPPDLMLATGTTGLQAYSLPREVGGEDADALTWGMALEQIGYRCMDSALPLIMNHQVDIARLICESGRADLIERYAMPLAQGRCGAGIAYTEDADAFSFRTILRRQKNDYVLSGYKSYITGGQMSDFFLTYALDETGDMQACLVQRDDPGVTVTPSEPLGMKTAGAASVTFDNVPLPGDRILAASDGLTHAQRFLSNQRLWIACAPLGRAQAVLDQCAAQLSGTLRYGETVAELKNVQASLGRMYVAVESARAMLYRALIRVTQDRTEPVFDPVVSAAKCFAVEQIRFVLERALNVLGGYGFYGNPHLGRYMRDFSGLTLAAGTQDILEVNLGAGVVARASRPSNLVHA
ncbi:acyl-CoA dehydrogenase family protein [Mycobacteroides franklinii]|uniref:Acryloyl-CoA reductase (NADH) n=1 Tax=Mycobacteroides franklinii TaxID=948102 RepID=A0A4R8QZL2_9MYCO|nr:Acryloyl-CoA reductase (NADH) [Mycobacteroides franklinii]TDZ49276.1 Acryloyl-CoA reductase (NADH) [Mycobacteroides franklinii]TDZ59456.1 Acryloyl-CoA reductase (NADH) [Mycobacteroides franklinii]TDZ66971.1 Acryloyl-CoA reductase (NADH) [Mycobacteroides franklinii]TDZ72895.1 Acryloyl-CoA reductase (NADH) [Mycobacteroides franklinii]